MYKSKTLLALQPIMQPLKLNFIATGISRPVEALACYPDHAAHIPCLQRDKLHGRCQYLFVESICNDMETLERNYKNKLMYSPDYAGVNVEEVREHVSEYVNMFPLLIFCFVLSGGQLGGAGRCSFTNH
jgi:hypothetical protein